MAIDLEKMKSKLEKLENKSSGSDFNFWKPTKEVETLRLLPDNDDPFVEKWMHYGIGNDSFICPKKMYGDDCPVCAFVDKLWEEYNETKDDETRNMAHNIKAKPRYYTWLVTRDEPTTPMLWGYSKTVVQDLINIVLNPDYGDITDPQKGHDLKVSSSLKSGAKYPTTDIQVRPAKTPLLDAQDEIDELLEKRANIDDLFQVKTFDEMSESLQKFFEGMDGVELGEDDAVDKFSDNKELDVDTMLAELRAEAANGDDE